MKIEKLIWVLLVLLSANSIHCMKRKFDRISLDENQSQMLRTFTEKGLVLSAKGNNIEGVKALLEMGANPNYQDEYNWTALMYAAINGNIDMVKLLLNSGALIYIENIEGQNVLDILREQIILDENWPVYHDSLDELNFPLDLSNLIMEYVKVSRETLSKIYKEILSFLENSEQVKKRNRQIKELLQAHVPVGDLQNIIVGYTN